MVSRRGKRGSTMKPYWSYCSFSLLRLQLGSWGFAANNISPAPRSPFSHHHSPSQHFLGERSPSSHSARLALAVVPSLQKTPLQAGEIKGCPWFPFSSCSHLRLPPRSFKPAPLHLFFPFSMGVRRRWGPFCLQPDPPRHRTLHRLIVHLSFPGHPAPL